MEVREYTEASMVKAFEKWEEDYRANPETFMDAAKGKSQTPQTVAVLCMALLMKLLDEVHEEDSPDIHSSSCARNNEPALPKGPCDCRV